MEEDTAFIGLGAMGYRMAGNLRRNMSRTARLFVNDVNRQACERFASEMGGQHGPVEVAATAKAAASGARTIISIVPQPDNVRQVYLGTAGVIEAPPDPERLLLECSTIDVQTTREVEIKLREAGIGRYFDSPVSGGVGGAEKGTLSFLVGHPAEGRDGSDPVTVTNKRILDMVTKMGSPEKVTFCGPLGTGLAAKIANNAIACTVMLATAEAMAVGIRSGVDKSTLFECLRNSTGQSWVLENMQPVPDLVPTAPSSNGYKPSFKPFMICKDVSLAVEAAHQVGIDPTMAETALKTYQKTADDPRCRDRDCTSVWLYINDIQDGDS